MQEFWCSLLPTPKPRQTPRPGSFCTKGDMSESRGFLGGRIAQCSELTHLQDSPGGAGRPGGERGDRMLGAMLAYYSCSPEP